MTTVLVFSEITTVLYRPEDESDDLPETSLIVDKVKALCKSYGMTLVDRSDPTRRTPAAGCIQIRTGHQKLVPSAIGRMPFLDNVSDDKLWDIMVRHQDWLDDNRLDRKAVIAPMTKYSIVTPEKLQALQNTLKSNSRKKFSCLYDENTTMFEVIIIAWVKPDAPVPRPMPTRPLSDRLQQKADAARRAEEEESESDSGTELSETIEGPPPLSRQEAQELSPKEKEERRALRKARNAQQRRHQRYLIKRLKEKRAEKLVKERERKEKEQEERERERSAQKETPAAAPERRTRRQREREERESGSSGSTPVAPGARRRPEPASSRLSREAREAKRAIQKEKERQRYEQARLQKMQREKAAKEKAQAQAQAQPSGGAASITQVTEAPLHVPGVIIARPGQAVPPGYRCVVQTPKGHKITPHGTSYTPSVPMSSRTPRTEAVSPRLHSPMMPITPQPGGDKFQVNLMVDLHEMSVIQKVLGELRGQY
ncbi:hypothetical protein KIPB_001242 [Kipferlia bialata]|uniref:Uncharacterized protein n=1 Tax=Kipferlia bialata TaxID=797122 RepID=A0A9K3GF35_9EUKA|nr:hypothetical protein KIPB_001242 [Kipferlia bialata]|eukprot:g1242.t1